MAKDKKNGAGSASVGNEPAATEDGADIRTLQKTIEDLQREVDALKERPAKPTPTSTVKTVIHRYVTLQRLVHDPEPRWQYPGSAPANT
jgi:hypothetical protein